MKKILFALLVALMGAMSVFTSCKEDDDDEILNVPPDSIVVDGAKVLDLGDYSFNFPTDENKEVPWRYGDYDKKFSYGDLVFNASAAIAKNDFAVRISIYEQIDEQAGKYKIGDLEYILDKYYYCEDGGYNLIEKNTNAKLGSADAIKYISTENETGAYTEQYLVYVEKTKKILLITMDMPADVKDKRFAELQTILKSFKLKK